MDDLGTGARASAGPGPLGGALLLAATVAAGLYAGVAGLMTAVAAGLAAAAVGAPLRAPEAS